MATDLRMEELRRRMAARGVRVADLAHEAGIRAGDLSSILHGHDYLGASRRLRLEQAIERLRLHEPEEDSGVRISGHSA